MAAFAEGQVAFTSKLFVFVVGKEKTPFTVHAAVVAKTSPALDRLMNGEMMEAQIGRSEQDDVGEDTFIRFCQFAYTGEYGTPAFTELASSELPDQAASSVLPPGARDIQSQAEDFSMLEETVMSILMSDMLKRQKQIDEYEGWTDAETVRRYRDKKARINKTREVRNEFKNRKYTPSPSEYRVVTRHRIRENRNSLEDYTAVFLAHAQLYIFAEKWLITDLKTLCLSKLHDTLSGFALHATRRTDIVELARCVYRLDVTADLEDDPDGLRALVMHYIVCEAESLIQCPDFIQLVKEGGDFAKDFVLMLMKRVEEL